MERIEDVLDESSKLPLSSKVLIDKEEILDIITEIRSNLPEEINRANWVAKERQRIIKEAKEEAKNTVMLAKEEANIILSKAEYKKDDLIDSTEIVKESTQRAEEILNIAESKANEMKSNAFEYSDKLLAKLQDNILYLLSIIEENRNELNN